LIAGQTGAVGLVVGLTVGGNSNTDPIAGVPEFTASKTNVFIPVPLSTANIGDLLSGSQLALSVVEVVSLVAGQAVAVSGVVSSTKVVDRSANAIVEIPEVGTGQTLLVGPVPLSASGIRREKRTLTVVGSNSQAPLLRTNPLKHEVHCPLVASYSLQRSETGTQIPALLKTQYLEHSTQAPF